MDVRQYLTKEQILGIYIQGALLIIGIIITLFNIYNYSIRGNMMVTIPFIMLMVVFASIFNYSMIDAEKGLRYYKIGIILLIISLCLAIPRFITLNLLLAILAMTEIILLIYFIMNLDKPKNAQKAINLVVIIGCAIEIFICIISGGVVSSNGNHILIEGFPAVLARGTFALSYYLGIKIEEKSHGINSK